MAAVITQSDLLDALTAAHTTPTEARTVAELATIHRQTKERIREAIGKLAMQNRINVHQKSYRTIDGRNVSVPAYTILPPPKKRK